LGVIVLLHPLPKRRPLSCSVPPPDSVESSVFSSVSCTACERCGGSNGWNHIPLSEVEAHVKKTELKDEELQAVDDTLAALSKSIDVDAGAATAPAQSEEEEAEEEKAGTESAQSEEEGVVHGQSEGSQHLKSDPVENTTPAEDNARKEISTLIQVARPTELTAEFLAFRLSITRQLDEVQHLHHAADRLEMLRGVRSHLMQVNAQRNAQKHQGPDQSVAPAGWYTGDPKVGQRNSHIMPSAVRTCTKAVALRQKAEYPGEKKSVKIDVGSIVEAPMKHTTFQWEGRMLNFYLVDVKGQRGWLLDFSPGANEWVLEICYHS